MCTKRNKMITFNVMTPTAFKTLNNNNTKMYYGFHPTPFGKCCIGLTSKDICHLSFVDDEDTSISKLKTEWPKVNFLQDEVRTSSMAQSIFNAAGNTEQPFSLRIRGTSFQAKVWESLTSIPEGSTRSYSDIASMIGKPNAVRAVATAIANNKIGYLIPCHRVISKTGDKNKYRWGSQRKKMLLDYEASQPRSQL